MKKNTPAWDTIFDKLDIVERVNRDSFFDLTATQIKEIGKREPRLMAKIDHRENLPEIMAKEKLSILAIKNGEYRIARTDPYINIPDIKTEDISSLGFDSNFLTISPDNVKSESNALDIAYISGMLTKVFNEETSLTIRGRERANCRFLINDKSDKEIEYDISGVQIEVDGGYEGKNSINLVEAKMGSRNNMSIRQLLYPELYWNSIIKKKKEVRTFFFLYQQPFYRFIPFLYKDGIFKLDNSAEKIFKFKQVESFDIRKIKVRKDSLVDITAPFPQADSFDKVLIIFDKIVNKDGITKSELSEEIVDDFDLTDRQIAYYTSALRWLNICELKDGALFLNRKGKELAELSVIDRIKEMSETIFTDEIFNLSLHSSVDSVPEKLFKDNWNISGSTIPRRKLTIQKWIDFIKASLNN
jgi:hypothetical protein